MLLCKLLDSLMIREWKEEVSQSRREEGAREGSGGQGYVFEAGRNEGREGGRERRRRRGGGKEW